MGCNEEWQKIRGCRKKGTQPHIYIDEQGKRHTLWRCPIALALPVDHELVRLWWIYRQHGTLPEPGGLYNQPAILVDAFDWLDGIYNEHMQEERKRWQRRLKHLK